MGKGGLKVQKPSRSDEVLDAQQQWQIEEQVKSQFEAMAPKRHKKPNRSELSDENGAFVEDSSEPLEIPELKRLEELRSSPAPIFVSDNGEVLTDEFVETDYYQNMDAEAKIHHTTGDGYIRLDYDGGSYYRLSYEDNGSLQKIPIKGNPAMNDWIPSSEDMVIPLSSKPLRSG